MNTTSTHSHHNGDQEYAGDVSISDFKSLISGGKWTIVLATATVFTLVALYTFLTKPVYESTARVVIDFRGAKDARSTFDFTGAIAATKITNELESLMSRSLCESVSYILVRRRYINGDGKTVLPVLSSTSDEMRGGRLVSLDVVMERVAQSVEFSPVKESDVIKISARSTDPREAAIIANTYTEAYAERNLSLSRAKSRAVREFLQSQVEAKQQLLDSAESALRTYMQRTSTVSLDDETKKLVEQLAQLEGTRDALDVDIRSREQTLQSYRSELAVQEPAIAKALGESNDNYIRLLQEQLARLEVQRDIVLAQTPENVNGGSNAAQLQEVESQIATLKTNLQARTKAYLSSLSPGGRVGEGNEGSTSFLAQMKQKVIEQKIELDGLRAKRGALVKVIADYEIHFNQLPKRSIDLAKLQRVRLSNEKLFALVDEKYSEAAIAEQSEFGSVNIIDPAAIPSKPVSPKVMLNLLLGLILGLGVGVGIVFARPALSSKIRSPEDIKQAGLPTLTVINRMVMNGKTRKTPDGKLLDMHLVAHTHRSSSVVESYRHLFTKVKSAQEKHQLQSVLVTSVKEGEGKSITVSNLAIVAAESDQRVLVVDTDLRRPMIHQIFGRNQEPGVMNVIDGDGLPGMIHLNVLPNVNVMCSGAAPPNPGAVIGSIKMRDLLLDLNRDFDLVLLDSPPIFAVNDPLILSTLVDAIILVVSAGDTTRTELEEGIEALGDMADKILGVVLNKFNRRKAYRPVAGGYGYGYAKYGEGYYRAKEVKQKEVYR